MQKLAAEMQPLASVTSLLLFGRRAWEAEAEGTGLGLAKGDRIGWRGEEQERMQDQVWGT